jgi:hypothetical protein
VPEVVCRLLPVPSGVLSTGLVVGGLPLLSGQLATPLLAMFHGWGNGTSGPAAVAIGSPARPLLSSVQLPEAAFALPTQIAPAGEGSTPTETPTAPQAKGLVGDDFMADLAAVLDQPGRDGGAHLPGLPAFGSGSSGNGGGGGTPITPSTFFEQQQAQGAAPSSSTGPSPLSFAPVTTTAQPAAATSQSTTTAQARVAAGLGNLPVAFEKNVGQTDSSVLYLAHGSGYEKTARNFLAFIHVASIMVLLQ